MDFEFDPAKSAANLLKHGIDFKEAQKIWMDENRLEITAASETENRQSVTGVIEDIFWTAIITYRADRIRIISVRRARTVEIENYHSG